MDKEPRPDTAPGTHEAVLRLLAAEPGNGSSIVDLGCGEGALSLALKNRGFRVWACDIDPKFKIPDIPWIKFDFNSNGLPFPESFFDYVACIELIEHLQDPYLLIRRANKLLKEDGRLILTMPNIMSIPARLTFALTGRFPFFEEGVIEHVNPIPFWELERGLVENGFVVETLVEAKIPRLTKALYPLCFFLRPKNKALLCGNILIVKAKKVSQIPDTGFTHPIGVINPAGLTK